MEFSPFKILISAIAVLALLYIFYTFLAPLFIWPTDAQKQIGDTINLAKAKPGKAIEAENTVFESGTLFSGNSFREAQLEVKFECNSISSCCDKGTKCSKEIEWNNASALFKQKKQIKTFARCDSQHNIAACIVFFGQKPAQLKIVNMSALEQTDLSKQNSYVIDLFVKNDGSIFAPGVFAKTKLFKLNQQKTTKELVLENITDETEINPEEQKLVPIILEIEIPGDYVAEIRAEGENSGFDETTVEFSVIGTDASLCKATEKGEIILDSPTGKCEQEYKCDGCYYSFECKNAWQAMEQKKVFVAGDPQHAMEITEPTNGSCQKETVPPVEIPKKEFCQINEITKANNPGFLGIGCLKNFELLKKYAQENGLTANGIDLLLLQALITEESKCNISPDGGKGLMQVESCKKDGCSTEENINRGTKIMNQDLEIIKSQGISGLNAAKLMLFSYNYGIASANKAMDFIFSGKKAEEAMLESCNFYYPKLVLGICYSFSKEKCCNSYGYGSRFPEKVLDTYKALCIAAGGNFSG